VLLTDLAAQLDTIGHLSALRRVASGAHHVDDAVTLDELDRRVASGTTVLLPPRSFVEQLESVVVTADQSLRLRQGQRVNLDTSSEVEIAALSESGSLVGVLRPRGESWQPTVIMPDEASSACG